MATATCISFRLPPLILHPFADEAGPGKLLDSSRANLILQGMLPGGEGGRSELERRVLEGRFCEIRMLYYVGKDVIRWMQQSVESVERMPEFAGRGIQIQDFATLLLDETPQDVREKLQDWGVADYRAIFSRGLGMNAVFAEAPQRHTLAEEFIHNYHLFADRMFSCTKKRTQPVDLRALGFTFDLYASGEYSRMLEREWEDGPSAA